MSSIVKYGWLLIEPRNDGTWKVEQPCAWFDKRQPHSNVMAIFDPKTNRPIHMEAIKEQETPPPDNEYYFRVKSPGVFQTTITNANLKLTFDGATNELKSAEVI